MYNMDKIKPKVEKDVYELEDAEYLLIDAIRDLINSLDALRARLK